jgi:hypothetical protein
MMLTGVKRASGAWNRSAPTLITLPSGSCFNPRTTPNVRTENFLSRHSSTFQTHKAKVLLEDFKGVLISVPKAQLFYIGFMS